MTFSVVARDPQSGDLGVAVQSKFPFVGTAVPFATAGVGAVATQAYVDVSFGPRGLALLAAGISPERTIEALLDGDPLAAQRQLAIVDATGRVAVHTGVECMDWAGHRTGPGWSCQGNILAGASVVDAMAAVMDDPTPLPFPDRLVRALAAAQAEGGDRRGQQAAAILVVRPGGGFSGGTDRFVDLRVDDHVAPIGELERLLGLHKLHFQRPTEAELLPLEGDLRAEVARLLGRLGELEAEAAARPSAGASADPVWIALERWAGVENYEERLVRPGVVDRLVLGVLRERAGAAG